MLRKIEFYNNSGISVPVNEEDIRELTDLISKGENCNIAFLEVVFVDEDEIIRINKKFLNRNYLTDVISFSYSDEQPASKPAIIDGSLFCCAQRIFEQSEEWNEEPGAEFRRIVIHGILHLIGYDDATDGQKQDMRMKENFYLKRFGLLHEN